LIIGFGEKMKLAPKIIILLLLVTFGVMSVYSFYQINKAEKSFINDAEGNHVLLLSNSIGFLSKSLWELDKDISLRGMKPIFELPTILEIKMYDVEGHFFSGMRYQIGDSNKKELIEIDSIQDADKTYLKELSDSRRPYDPVPSKMVSSMIKITDDTYRMVGSLWWKETEVSEPKFLGFVILEFTTDYIAKRLMDQKISFVVLTIGLSFIIILLTYLFLEVQIISPIRKLMIASLNIAAGEFTKLEEPKNPNSRDEIDKLTTNFNFMTNKIEQSLNLIKGLSDAAQIIVKCVNIQDAINVFEKYLINLVELKKVEIWLNSRKEVNIIIRELEAVSNNKKITYDNQIFDHITKKSDIFKFERNVNLLGETIDDSIIILPLTNSKNIVIGIIELYFKSSEKSLNNESIQIIKTLTSSLLIAIENDWRIQTEKNRANLERDVELASAVQDAILSKNIPKNYYFNYSTFFKNAGQCGGDWFGVYEVSDSKILVLFGDVTGHGTPAALITAVSRGAADMLLQFIKLGKADISHNFPAKVLEFMNECITETGKQTYLMTMVVALIDFKEQKIFASSAGHTPPALITLKDAKVEVKYIYPPANSRLGFTKGTVYEVEQYEFVPGQQIVFYTDGIIEGESPDKKEYGFKKFKKSMETHGMLEINDFTKKITNDAYAFFGEVPQKDDIALLVIRFLQN
jgi:serine phosphatase RsbU (regulator of sigma subunit)/HAMP domain-containing protein